MNILSQAKKGALLSAAALTVAVLAAGAPAAHAQNILRITIPFNFQEGKTELPAGKYDVTLMDHCLLQMSNGRSQGMIAVVDGGKDAKTNKLVFHRVGERYFLRSVWIAGSNTEVEIPRTKAEKRMELAAVQAGQTNEYVAVLEMPR